MELTQVVEEERDTAVGKNVKVQFSNELKRQSLAQAIAAPYLALQRGLCSLSPDRDA